LWRHHHKIVYWNDADERKAKKSKKVGLLRTIKEDGGIEFNFSAK
jgi:hypothetical protein